MRALAPEAVIYVLSGVLPGTGLALAEARLRPVINSVTELAEWDAFVSVNQLAWRRGAPCRHRHEPARIDAARKRAPSRRASSPEITASSLLMSHLACAETPDHAMNDKQIRLFRDIRIQFRGIASSLANSSGIFLGGTVHCDLVRPGAALYGVNPTPGKRNPMRPVVELKGRILQVRHLAARRQRGLSRGLDRCAPEPDRHHRGRLWRRLSARRRDQRQAGRARLSSPASTARWSAASPWI